MQSARSIALSKAGPALLAAALMTGPLRAQDSPPVEPVQPTIQPSGPTPVLDDEFEGRPISRIRLERPLVGQPGVTEPIDPALAQIVRNNIRTREGAEFHADVATNDAQLLNRLERFGTIVHSVQPMADGSVTVIFLLVERPVIQDVQPVGNHRMSDGDIRAIAEKLVGTAVADQVIQSVARDIESAYRKKGYYRVKVAADQDELAETGILYYRIREGERLRVTDIRFTAVEGELIFHPSELDDDIQTDVYIPLINKGLLDEEQLEQDVAALAKFYRDRGYLDVRVDRVVIEAPNGKEAIVEFVITSGRRYVMRRVIAYYPQRARYFATREEALAAAGPDDYVLVRSAESVAVYTMGLYSSEQIAGLIPIKTGDVYSAELLDRSELTVRDAYGKQGYTDALRPDGKGIVTTQALRDEVEPFVDLVFEIREGPSYKTGAVTIIGNPITRQGVIRRQIEISPDHPLDTTAVKRSEAQLGQNGSRLFSPEPPGPTLTLQDPSPSQPGYRDVLTEVKDTNTGTLFLNGSVSSDGGLTVGVGMTQRNFDIAKTPDSWGELFSGRAFRGGGQVFTLDASPGTTFQNYSATLSDPAINDSNYSLDAAKVFYSFSNYSQYDEERYGMRVGFGRRFGSRWTANLTLRNEWVALSDLEPDSPVDFYEVADLSRLTGLGLGLGRTSVPSLERFAPTRGNRIAFSVEQVGALGGDYDFTKLRGEYAVYLPIFDTFYGKTTVLSFQTNVSYIPQSADDVPAYERYYLGGQNFRGFALRAIAPKGIRADTGTVGDVTVGGTWSFFFGTEVRQPVPFAPEYLSVVGFIDSGTVTDSVGFDDYRVSIGAGIRLTVPALSPVPLAFDFAVPLINEQDDETRLFSFSIDVPFR